MTPEERVRAWALTIFRRQDLAEAWLYRRNRWFHDKAPIELVGDDAGADMVVEQLTDAIFGTAEILNLAGDRPQPTKQKALAGKN